MSALDRILMMSTAFCFFGMALVAALPDLSPKDKRVHLFRAVPICNEADYVCVLEREYILKQR